MAIVLLAPILSGVVGVVLPAFGFHPGLDKFDISIAPLRNLFADPSIGRATLTTLVSGVGTSLIAVVAAFAFCAAFHHTPWFARARGSLAAALALPQASFAVGFAFLLAPSGFLARVVSPGLTGWSDPPDLLTIGDPLALALLAALSLKEVLFLVLMISAALGQIPTESLVRTARSFGYGPIRAWSLVIAPLVYRQVRLPVYAVIAASLGSVDMALVLGPSAPPTLAPLILGWFRDFDVDFQITAAAGAVWLLVLTLAVIAVCRAAEMAIARGGRILFFLGRRSGPLDGVAIGVGGLGVALSIAASGAAVMLLLAWSFAGQWPWPEALPITWTSQHWGSTAASLARLFWQTTVIAVASAAIAMVLSIATLEAQGDEPPSWWNAIVFAPLLLPQIGFLFGVQVLWSWARWDGEVTSVIWTHLLFVTPYVYLSLRDPFSALDPRLERVSRSLGKSRLETLLRVKLPLLSRQLLLAAAIGFTVSVGLYLPTVIAGAGRVSTLATETIAQSSGGDRRTLGVVGLVLAALPFLALTGALVTSRALSRDRRGLRA